MKYMLGLVMIGLLAAPIGRAQTRNSAEKELIEVENAWKQAVVKRDAPALQRLGQQVVGRVAWDGVPGGDAHADGHAVQIRRAVRADLDGGGRRGSA